MAVSAQFSFAWDCPASSDLTDPHTRNRCLYKVLAHWRESIQIEVIKTWQKAYAKTSPRSGLASAGHYSTWGNTSLNENLKRLETYQRLLDPLENEGTYQDLPTTLTCSSDDD